MPRKGPAIPEMVPLDKGIEVKKKLEVSSSSYSALSARCNVSVSGEGKYYFEVRLLTTGSCRIGWSSDKFTGKSALGDEPGSYGFDGSNNRKYGGNGERYGQSYGSDNWNQGDIIGCLLDLSQQTISYTLNGEELGTAFSGVVSSSELSPTVTLFKKQKVIFNFGSEEFCSPQPGANTLHMRVSQSEIENLERVFDSYCSKSTTSSQEAEEEAAAAAASGKAEKKIESEGLLQLANDLGSKGDLDPLLLIVLWKLGCKKQWIITHEEFVGGFVNHGVGSIQAAKKKVLEWRRNIEEQSGFADFYNFVFEYLRGESKTLSSQDAILGWQTLEMDRHWPLYKDWEAFYKSIERKGLTRDNWQQLVPFMQKFQSNLSSYDASDCCWPSLYDEFVEWLSRNKKQ